MNSPIDPLTDIERRLENRTVAGPSAALASRVRDDVAAVLRSPRRAAMPTSWLSFAAGLAAVFVIGTSLSQIAVSEPRAERQTRDLDLGSANAGHGRGRFANWLRNCPKARHGA